MPSLTSAVINRIINDIAPTADGLRRVGVVGSYARNDYTISSDVDLVFDMEKGAEDAILASTGARLRAIFMNQFRTNLDVINYNSILQRLDEPEKLTCYQVDGYRQMLIDLIWIWERRL